MGSMGLLLADWSVELFRARRRRAKKAKLERAEGGARCVSYVETPEDPLAVADGAGCQGCEEATRALEEARAGLARAGGEADRLHHLVGAGPGEVVAAVEELVTGAGQLRTEVEQLREEGRRMAESVGRQLTDRDTAHGERVRALETLMAEKEKQLVASSGLLRQQLAQGRKERDQLQRRLEERREEAGGGHSGPGHSGHSGPGHSGPGHWEAECASMQLVLDIRREEAEQLRAANNSLRLELERCQALEAQLQVQRQRTEELGLVVGMKNDQLRQVLDEYDCVQQQLEVEVSAHLACQQELERSQWVADSILSPAQQSPAREKSWKNLSNQAESGLILDVVQKGDKGLAYSFNC